MSTTGAAPAADETLDFGRALRFVTDDPDWVRKILLGGLFTLLGAVIVGALFVAGYLVALIRRAARNERYPLPDWDDLGRCFVDGLLAAALYLAHLLAVLAVPAALGCVVALFAGGLGSMSGSRDAEEAIGALLGIGIMGLYALMMLVMLALYVYVPAALVRFALLGRLSAGFEVRENVDFIRRNLTNYVLALVLYLVASFVAQFAILLCCLPFFPASFWATCVLGWALGETARRDPVLSPAARVQV
jgi:hypothetical protein